MATATSPVALPPAPALPPAVAWSQQRFVLDEASWQLYEMHLKARGKRRYRITYDRGRLELMTLSPRHERIEEIFARFFWVLSEELDVPIEGFGSMTMRRKELARGLEADRCYYIQNEPLIRGHEDIDLDRDPPPDLALEIDISRSSLDRMGIYAALRIPELWRYDGELLRVYLLQPNGEYEEVKRSRTFPYLDLERVAAFVRQRTSLDTLSLMRSFRAWVRAEVVPQSGRTTQSS